MDGIALGWADIGAGGLVVLVVLLILTDRLRPAKRADRELDVISEQRDEAMAGWREAREINREHAEAMREVAPVLERIADGQEVILRVVQALPRGTGGGEG